MFLCYLRSQICATKPKSSMQSHDHEDGRVCLFGRLSLSSLLCSSARVRSIWFNRCSCQSWASVRWTLNHFVDLHICDWLSLIDFLMTYSADDSQRIGQLMDWLTRPEWIPGENKRLDRPLIITFVHIEGLSRGRSNKWWYLPCKQRFDQYVCVLLLDEMADSSIIIV